jgi:hypothetical protein
MANKDVLKFEAIFAMKAVEFLNYALLIHDILEAERMEAERMRRRVGHNLRAGHLPAWSLMYSSVGRARN